VLQEAVRRVLVRNRLLPNEDQVRKYLGRAIANTAIELYYSRKRDRRRHVALQENALPWTFSATPQTILEEKERSQQKESMIRALNDALRRLPTKQYEAVRMTMLEPGITSIRDAGALNGIAYSTLRHRSVQGLLRLRKIVQQAIRSAMLRAGIL
jgi:DNA-directed RNA polymerase specialized sigma24 family protein